MSTRYCGVNTLSYLPSQHTHPSLSPPHTCTFSPPLQEKEEEVVSLTEKLYSLENTLDALKQSEASSKRQWAQTESIYKRQLGELQQESREDKKQLAEAAHEMHVIKRQIVDTQVELKEAKRQGLEAQQQQQETRRQLSDVQQELVQRDRTISGMKKEVGELTLQLQQHDDTAHRRGLESKFELMSMTEKMHANEDLFRRREQHWRSEHDALVR